jgi:hypothetical protein
MSQLDEQRQPGKYSVHVIPDLVFHKCKMNTIDCLLSSVQNCTTRLNVRTERQVELKAEINALIELTNPIEFLQNQTLCWNSIRELDCPRVQIVENLPSPIDDLPTPSVLSIDPNEQITKLGFYWKSAPLKTIECAKKNPDNRLAFLFQISALQELHRDTEADELLREFRKLTDLNTLESGLCTYFSKDYTKAMLILKSTDHSLAQFIFGKMYDRGLETGTSKYEAMRWYQLSADQGYAVAQVQLGYNLIHGIGCEHDVARGIAMYRLAAGQNYSSGQNSLGACYLKGLGVEKDEVEAVKYFRLAAEQGHVSAQYNLGVCYADDVGPFKCSPEFWAIQLRSNQVV